MFVRTKKLLALFSLATFLPLSGCGTLLMASGWRPDGWVEFEKGGQNFQYQTIDQSSIHFANSKSVKLSTDVSESEKVRALLGYPTFAAQPLYLFSMGHLMYSNEQAVERDIGQLSPEHKAKFNQDDALAVASSLGGTAGAATAIAAVASGPTVDPRNIGGQALCYVAKSQFSVANDALQHCFDQLTAMSLAMTVPDGKVSDRVDSLIVVKGKIKTLAGQVEPVAMRIGSKSVFYTQGFAPEDKGGSESHLFLMTYDPHVFVPGSLSSQTEPFSKATVEDLAAALKPHKPDNIVLYLPANRDYRQREGHEAIGIY